MNKSFDPKDFEDRIYSKWLSAQAFDAEDVSNKPSFCIPMPPPNVTGVLHNGHALFVTLQDILVRWKRMRGFNALWLPGTDHAGIATQMVVERELAKQGLKRQEIGRPEFLKRVWAWKERHGNLIFDQMKKLGASADWKRAQFTLDPHLSQAVQEVFVRLYEEGRVYRGTRIIHWCLRCQTALSDLEVVSKEKKGHFWHILYESVERPGQHLTIATTRPETLLGDTAVAVNPNDERYRQWIGKRIRVPLVGREVLVIADEYVDPQMGTGALKITPAHDFNDFDLGLKHGLDSINILSKQGTIDFHGQKGFESVTEYQGLKLSQAREKILAELQEKNLLSKTIEYTHQVSCCQRCETVLEPLVSMQWFVNVKSLAEKAINAVQNGESLSLQEVDQREDAVKILPESWKNTYYHWMNNIRDWCISRQLWWGHQIPAWYCENCSHVHVARKAPQQCEKCHCSKLEQDEDVLDTWFSSALWPFSTLGWPQKTKAYQTFYPTSILETGFDILFFWVARMLMMGIHFNEGRVPFKRIYLHAMVRDEKGQKMSKTKGNVIDPLDVIREYGADAFRFTLAAMAGQGRDIRLSLERVEGYKSFCNKLWNASRYVLMRFEMAENVQSLSVWLRGKSLGDSLLHRFEFLHPINQWILMELDQATQTVEESLDQFRPNDAAQTVYDFIWAKYCDWYIEFSKEIFNLQGQPEVHEETKACMLYVLQEALKLAHPFIPFITEEIYQYLPLRKQELLITSDFPMVHGLNLRSNRVQCVQLWKEAIEKLREFRGENNVSPKARPSLYVEVLDKDQHAMLNEGAAFIKSLGQFQTIAGRTENQSKSSDAEIRLKGVRFWIPLEGLVDVQEELKRLEKEKNTVQKDIDFLKQKLARPEFIQKAPAALVQKEQERLAEFEKQCTEIEKNIAKFLSLTAQSP